MNEELSRIVGTIQHVIYQNEENGYTVLSLDTEDGDNATVVGCLPFAAPGETLTAEGTWETHPSHGPQFKVVYARRSLPTGEKHIFDYLSSGAVHGIGAATASVLVSRFGTRTLEVMLQHPEEIAAIRGIGEKKARTICEEFRRQTGLRALMEFLDQYNIRPEYAVRLYRIYEDKALDILQTNPYVLMAESVGCRFADADYLADQLGFEADCPERISAAVLYEMKHNLRNGHTFLPRDKLIAATSGLTGVESESVDECVGEMLDSGEIVEQPVANVDAVYLRSLYEAECYTANRLLEMTKNSTGKRPGKADAIASQMERQEKFELTPMQRLAMQSALTERVLAVTGGPGTGKTTTIRGILRLFESEKITAILAAPTGRAAKRMTEVTGQEAFTIHRLLGATRSLEEDEVTFRKNEDDPLKCDAVILDECSMIDITLAAALLRALPKNCRLILVGDADQLPSVGPGAFFGDVLRSNAIPCVSLTQVFRQKRDQSQIIESAVFVLRGELPDVRANKGDFFFLQRYDGEKLVSTVVDLCSRRLPEGMNFAREDIQVLTPTRVGDAGTVSLNRRLQEALNPPAENKQEKKYGEVVFREGDRVMQIRNNYDIVWCRGGDAEAITSGQTSPGSAPESGSGVFNGDLGTILRIDRQNEMLWIAFDDKLAWYGFEQLNELEHAFAITVHKSQGSEYRAVVLALGRAPSRLLCRDVLYTAITRARECLVVVGELETLTTMVLNAYRARRYSGLRARLAGEVHS